MSDNIYDPELGRVLTDEEMLKREKGEEIKEEAMETVDPQS